MRDTFDRFVRPLFLYQIAGSVLAFAFVAWIVFVFSVSCAIVFGYPYRAYRNWRHPFQKLDTEKKQQ